MSPLTRELIFYRTEFYKEAPEQASSWEKVKTALCGRVLALSISLILHAEAVCRAVYICFLHLQQIFVSSNEELYSKQLWGQAENAYAESLKSFFGLFNRASFEKLPEAKLQKIASPQIKPQDLSSKKDPLPVLQPDQTPHVALQPEQQTQDQPHQEDEPPVPALQLQQAAIQPEQQIQDQPHQEDEPFVLVPHPPQVAIQPESDDDSDFVHISEADALPLHQALGYVRVDHKDASDDDFKEIDLNTQEAPPLSQAVGQRPPKLKVHHHPIDSDNDTSPTDSDNGTPRTGTLRINNGDVFINEHYGEQAAGIEQTIYLANREAAHQKTTGQNIQFQFQEIFLPKWEVARGIVGDLSKPYQVGFCGSEKNKFKSLFRALELTINKTPYVIPLFGIFDPQGKTDAAAFLYERLEAKLMASLRIHNPDKLTKTGIWNAIHSAIVELNNEFTDNATSSLTIALFIDQQLWVAHLGNSGAILDNQGQAILLSANLGQESPAAFGSKDISESLKITCTDLRPNSHLVLGTNSIFKYAAPESIVTWTQKGKEKAPLGLACGIVSSVEDGSCLIVKIA